MLKRREVIAMLGAVAASARAASARAQAGKVYRIGILETIPAQQNAANFAGLSRGLRESGYVEGQNLVIEYRSADGRAEQFPKRAAELIGMPVDLIVARPGGNVTGLSSFWTELAGKRVELLKDTAPSAARVGFLMNMGNPIAPPAWEATALPQRRSGLPPNCSTCELRRTSRARSQPSLA